MTINVLVPTIRSNLIDKCLASLAAQERKPDKIIVVIQDADKRLQKIVDNFKQSHPLNIEKVYVSKPGVVEALNAGIKVTNSDILCFIDDDAQAKPDWLKLIEAYYKNRQIGGIGGRDLIHFRGAIEEKRVNRIGQITWYGKPVSNHHNIVGDARETEYLKGCNMSYRRELVPLIDKKLQTEEGIAEPWWELDMAFKVKKKGYQIWYDPKIIVDHYPTTKEYHLDRRNFTSIRNQTYLLLKNLPLLKKTIFIFYTFIIGNTGNPGYFFFLSEMIKPNPPGIKTLKRKFFSKIEGICLWGRIPWGHTTLYK